MTQTDMTRTEALEQAKALFTEIVAVYPEREEPPPFVPTRTALMALLKKGVSPLELIRAARNYRTYCEQEHTPLRFRIGMTRFYRDNLWTRYNVPTVHGRTREEWARSGQDVAEFDRLVNADH